MNSSSIRRTSDPAPEKFITSVMSYLKINHQFDFINGQELK